jgi:hypothetical protein
MACIQGFCPTPGKAGVNDSHGGLVIPATIRPGSGIDAWGGTMPKARRRNTKRPPAAMRGGPVRLSDGQISPGGP